MRLSLISIGKPEIGMKLCTHLDIINGEKWIFADPENDAYDRLKLNRGWGTMIRPATAFRFRDRIFGSSGEQKKKKQGSMDQVSPFIYNISIRQVLSPHVWRLSTSFDFTCNHSCLKFWASGKMVSVESVCVLIIYSALGCSMSENSWLHYHR